MQDTSTNAMTEVALGLSMAFFSLLIVALLSTTLTSESSSANDSALVLDKSPSIALRDSSKSEGTSTENESHYFAFYFDGEFYDKELNKIGAHSLKQHDDLVVALMPGLSIEQALEIQKLVASDTARLTTMDERWQTLFLAK